MPSRLDELRRQRALLQEHLAWLDREIANEAGSGVKPLIAPGTVASRPAPHTASVSTPITASVPTAVDELFEQLREEDKKKNAPPSKTGCWVVFSILLLVFVGTAGALIYFFYR